MRYSTGNLQGAGILEDQNPRQKFLELYVDAYTGFGIYEPLQKRLMNVVSNIAAQNLFPGQDVVSQRKGVNNASL